jgi:EmrB/QacA subfamily drug resistance transporter
MAVDAPAELTLDSPPGRWVLAVAVLGSGLAFLDGTVVNVALPAIGRDLGASTSALQWILNGYLLTLASLILLGGSLGDRYGRRRFFVAGVALFTVASLLCAIAPSAGLLVAARLLQGIGGALLTPGSLAMLEASFRRSDRARAIGAWSGLAGVTTALGPLLGGYLVEAVSWRAVFLINLPIGIFVVAMAIRHVPETRDPMASAQLDVRGALLAALGLAGTTYALIEGPDRGMTGVIVLTGAGGTAALAAFLLAERRSAHPMIPLGIFASRQFSAANLVTFAVYASLSGVFFLLVAFLQISIGYSPIAAGAAALPVTALMLLLSARAGALAQRIGPRLPLTLGPVIIAAGMLLMTPARGPRLRPRPDARRRAGHRDRAGRRRRPPRRDRLGHQQRRLQGRQPARHRGPAARRGPQRRQVLRPCRARPRVPDRDHHLRGAGGSRRGHRVADDQRRRAPRRDRAGRRGAGPPRE